MSKEEFEAIECVSEYLRDMACEYAHQNRILFEKCFILKELPPEEYKRQTEEFVFWEKSYCVYSKFYLSVCKLYRNGDLTNKEG